MILKYEELFNPIEFQQLDSDKFRKHLNYRCGQAFGEEIMKLIEFKEQPREQQEIKFKAELHVLPQSQYEHVISLLKTVRSISPDTYYIVSQIIAEL